MIFNTLEKRVLVKWDHHCTNFLASPLSSSLSLIQKYRTFLILSLNTPAFVSSKPLHILTPGVPDFMEYNWAFFHSTTSVLPLSVSGFKHAHHQSADILEPFPTPFFWIRRTCLHHIIWFSLKLT